jgi:HEAT repeat protein
VKIAALVLCVLGLGWPFAGQAPASRDQPISPAQLKAAIDNLGKFDAATRTTAARAVRRAPPAQAVPALMEAAAGHADGYVRFRALVLLSGFNDPRARESMSTALDDPNDRLRTVAYA